MRVDHAVELGEIGRLHGHVCFGLAVGYRAAWIAKREFKLGLPGDDPEVIVVMEQNNCCEDAIQMVTSCSWHRGGIIFQDCGPYVFIFYNYTTGKSLRLSLKQNLVASWQEIHRLKKKVIQQQAGTEEEKERFWKLNQRFVDMFMKAKQEELFDVQWVEMTLLVKADRYNSLYVPQLKHPPPLNTCPCSSDKKS